MRVVVKVNVRQLKLALFLHEDLIRSVDHDFGYGVVLKERLKRSESEQFVADVVDELNSFAARQSVGAFRQFAVAVNGNDIFNLVASLFAANENLLFFRRHFVDDSAVNGKLEFLHYVVV